MKSPDEFKTYFEQVMLTDLEALDVRRKRIVKRWTTLLLFCLVALLLIITLFVTIKDLNNTIVFALIGAIVIIILATVIIGTKWASDKTFYSDFKIQVIERIVKFVSPDLSYDPSKHIGIDSFQRSRIFMKNADRYKGDDMVEGRIDKTDVWFSEVKAEYKTTTTDSKGRTKTTWHTIFKGLFFMADFNKHFQTSTIVLPNRLGKGMLASFFNKINLSRKEKHVSLEDPDFNKHFVVYGMDQIEARYVLSPALMRRITEFKEKHPNPLYISFVNSFLYVAIAYKKDLFEPNYFKKLTRFDLVKEFFEDIHLAVSIVEELNLNNRIWTKQ